jgi:HK97 family phage portal protein
MGLSLPWRRAAAPEKRNLSGLQFFPPQLPAMPVLPEADVPWEFAEMAGNSALAVADAYACVRVLSEAAASLPLHIYRQIPDGRQRLRNGTDQLLLYPAPGMTQSTLVGQIVLQLNLYGNAFLGKFRDGQGRISRLSLLPPQAVSVAMTNGVLQFTVSGQGGQTIHTVDDIIHIKALSQDGLIGLSPVKQAKRALQLSLSLSANAQSFWTNYAQPLGYISLPEGADPDPKQLAEILREFEDEHSGHRAHRLAILANGAKFETVQIPADDAQFLEQRMLSSVEVARIFRVPAHMIGAEIPHGGRSQTYANLEQQSLEFVQYSLRPWLVQIEQALSCDGDLFNKNTYCEFKLDALLRADSASRSAFYTAALGNPITGAPGWMTRREVRLLENLDPEEEADDNPND